MIAVAVMAAASQTAAQKPAFDVASIKASNPSANGGFIRPVGDRLTASNVPLKLLVVYAYRAGDGSSFLNSQLLGGPDWLDKERFDVEAKAAVQPRTSDDFRPMVQALMAERFKLVVHRETRDLPVFALVVGKNGAKLKNSDPDAPEGGSVRSSADGLHMETKKGSMAALARQLSSSAGRPVIDKTGLAGTYEYTLNWFPVTQIPAPESKVPSLFIAVQEQLGLRLDSTTAPQEVLVIDSVSKPSEN